MYHGIADVRLRRETAGLGVVDVKVYRGAAAVIIDWWKRSFTNAISVAVERHVTRSGSVIVDGGVLPHWESVGHREDLGKLALAVCARKICSEDGLKVSRMESGDAVRIEQLVNLFVEVGPRLLLLDRVDESGFDSIKYLLLLDARYCERALLEYLERFIRDDAV